MTFLARIKVENQSHSITYPYSIPCIQNGLDIEFTTKVTLFVGENGSGKSTILEAIAQKCGFNPAGGSRNNHYEYTQTESGLAEHMKLFRRPVRINRGFFFRAESFFNFADHIDHLAKQGEYAAYEPYGGKSLHEQSHGESFLSLIRNRFSINQKSIYIMDEPEAALSPLKLLTFISILRQLEQTGNSQFIIATHSPILLGYPGAVIYNTNSEKLEKIGYSETDHYNITRRFFESPKAYYDDLFKDTE